MNARGATYSFEMKRSLLTFLPGAPFANRGVSVHISFAFSRTMLQWRSKALTRARILRLFRQEIRTCVRERTAVWRMERGPVVSSCSSTWATSYSLYSCQTRATDWERTLVRTSILTWAWREALCDVLAHADDVGEEVRTESLHRPFCIVVKLDEQVRWVCDNQV